MSSIAFHDFFDRLQSATDVENQSQLAQTLGVGRAAISLAKQKDAVPWKWIFFLAETYDLNPNWLATGQGSSRITEAEATSSFIHLAHLRPKTDLEDGRLFLEKTSPRLALPPLWPVPLEHMVTMSMPGPCMHPEIKEDDLILIDQNQHTICPGGIYAFALHGHVLVRRVDIRGQGVTLICDNPTFPVQNLDPEEWQEVELFGRVLGSLRILSLQQG